MRLFDTHPGFGVGYFAMRTSSSVTWLCLAIIVLAIAASCAGLFMRQGEPFSFTSARGDAVRMYGTGLYRLDTIMIGSGFRGQDAVTLFLGIPLLITSLFLYRRGSLRGGVLLVGVLAFFLYVYVSMAFSAAYNNLFLVYAGLMSASFFALAQAFTSVDLGGLTAETLAGLPRRGPAILLIGGGALTFLVWIGPLASALAQGKTPDLLGPYTTFVTYALDLGIITPACCTAGILMLRRNRMGYRIAFLLFGIIIMLLPVITASTISQVCAGIRFTPGKIIGPIAGFGVIGALAIWAMAAILRSIPARASAARAAGGT